MKTVRTVILTIAICLLCCFFIMTISTASDASFVHWPVGYWFSGIKIFFLIIGIAFSIIGGIFSFALYKLADCEESEEDPDNDLRDTGFYEKGISQQAYTISMQRKVSEKARPIRERIEPAREEKAFDSQSVFSDETIPASPDIGADEISEEDQFLFTPIAEPVTSVTLETADANDGINNEAAAKQSKCIFCGHILDKGISFCPYCGKRIQNL